jgi:hypothetical protein
MKLIQEKKQFVFKHAPRWLGSRGFEKIYRKEIDLAVREAAMNMFVANPLESAKWAEAHYRVKLKVELAYVICTNPHMPPKYVTAHMAKTIKDLWEAHMVKTVADLQEAHAQAASMEATG